MATHSSILAWRTPWTEESGGLQSTRSQGIGHDCAHTRSTLTKHPVPPAPAQLLFFVFFVCVLRVKKSIINPRKGMALPGL